MYEHDGQKEWWHRGHVIGTSKELEGDYNSQLPQVQYRPHGHVKLSCVVHSGHTSLVPLGADQQSELEHRRPVLSLALLVIVQAGEWQDIGLGGCNRVTIPESPAMIDDDSILPVLSSGKGRPGHQLSSDEQNQCVHIGH